MINTYSHVDAKKIRSIVCQLIVYVFTLATIISFIPLRASAIPECDYVFYSGNDILFYDPCTETCSSTERGLVTSLKGNNNRDKIWNFLLQSGLSADQAAGVLGNIQVESGSTFTPTINEYDPGFPGGGYGIVQWTHTPGRRADIVERMILDSPTLMDKYYKEEYSRQGQSYHYSGFEANGFRARNANTHEVIPEADNDKLLLSQLNFMVEESSTKRKISASTARKVPGLTVGENEFEALRRQTSIKGASDIWVYNFEIPGNIDATAANRVTLGQEIYDMYTGSAGSSGSNLSASDCDTSLLPSELRRRVITIARQELAKWDSGEIQPGGYDVYLQGNSKTDWCAYFVSWVYKEAGYPIVDDPSTTPNVGYAFANVSAQREQAENGNRFTWHPNDGTYTPQPGDLAIHGYHVNIVTSATSPTNYVTIGGNEGAGGNGNAEQSRVKYNSGSYWSTQAEGYMSPN